MPEEVKRETPAAQPEQPAVSETPAEVQQPVAQMQQEKRQDTNWREVRAMMAAQKAEIDRLKAERETEKDAEEFKDLAPDDYITVAKAQKLVEKRAERKAQEIASRVVEERFRQHEHNSMEERMRSSAQDYDYVVENYIEPMLANNRALVEALKASPNPYQMAYNMAKASEEYQRDQSKQTVSPKAEKILKNSERPLPASASGSSFKTETDKYANMSKEDVWKMSQEFSRKG